MKIMTENGQLGARKLLAGLLAAATLFGAYCVATAGISALLAAATDISAQAHGGHGHGSHGHWSSGHWGGGHYWRGGWGRGRYWHGRWWGPGIGPCWRWTPIGWVWIC